MITRNSIDLKRLNEPCFAATMNYFCLILSKRHSGCGTYKCPFYKPKNCKEWVRIEDNTGINLIPPEDLFRDRSEL